MDRCRSCGALLLEQDAQQSLLELEQTARHLPSFRNQKSRAQWARRNGPLCKECLAKRKGGSAQ